MSFKLINFPIEIPLSEYMNLKKKLVKVLLAESSVLGVYQMGSVKNPGISDLDLICVFKNESGCNLDLRSNLNEIEKNILTHGVFGIEERNVFKALSYNMISNLKFLGGVDSLKNLAQSTFDETLKPQIAVEYLLKMYLTLDAQIHFNIVNLRSFLLLGKAIAFDLELLGVTKGELFDLVKKVNEYRSSWFVNQPKENDIKITILDYYYSLKDFIYETIKEYEFYLPKEDIRLPGSFVIVRSNDFCIKRNGFVFPKQFMFLGKYYIKLNYKFNRFIYEIPFNLPKESSLVNNRFEFGKELTKRNSKMFPNFLPITSSLRIY